MTKVKRIQQQVMHNIKTTVEGCARDLISRAGMDAPQAAIFVGHQLVGQATGLSCCPINRNTAR